MSITNQSKKVNPFLLSRWLSIHKMSSKSIYDFLHYPGTDTQTISVALGLVFYSTNKLQHASGSLN